MDSELPTIEVNELPQEEDSVSTRGASEFAPAPLALGRYVPLHQLGKGGMGVVYAAYDPKLDRKVAIKVLHPRNSSQGEDVDHARARLLRESQSLAQLSHPNVITVHDVGSIGERVFMVMEFVEGLTLRQWIQRGEHGWREAVDVLSRAGRGLAAAHVAGIVHRDFKPGNVIIGDDGRVRVLDFGLARASDGDDSADDHSRPIEEPPTPTSGSASIAAPLTEAGTVMGTPGYMAPEQYLGRASDARSDQYGFCVVLYESLYGRRPFVARDRDKLRRLVLAGRLDEAPAGTNVPGWLRRVVLRGLHIDPDQRFASMEALLAAMAGDPALRRRRRAVAVGLVIALGGGLFAAARAAEQPRPCADSERKLVGIWDDSIRTAASNAFASNRKSFAGGAWDRVEPIVDAWANGWVAMHTETCEATHVYGEQSNELLDLRMLCLDVHLRELSALGNLLANADDMVVQRAVQAASSLPPLSACADAEALQSGVRPPPDASTADAVQAVRAELAIARALGRAGKYVEAIATAESAVQAASEISYAPAEAEALYELGVNQENAGQAEASALSLHRAIEVAERSRHDRVRHKALRTLVHTVGYLQARHTEGLRYGRQAEAVLARIGGSDIEYARLWYFMGDVFLKQGHSDQALEYGQRSLTILERDLPADDLELAQVHSKLGIIYQERGAYDDALVHQERARTIWTRRLGEAHPRVGVALINIGVVYNNLGRFEDALATERAAMAIHEKAFGPDHANVALCLVNIAAALQDLERYEDSVAELEHARRILERTRGRDHPTVATVLNNIGNAHRLAGTHEKALEYLELALTTYERALDARHPTLAYPLTNIGRVHLEGLAAPRAALPMLERAVQIRAAHTVGAELLAESRFMLARALWEAGADRPRARALAAQARDGYGDAGEQFREDLEKTQAWLAAR